MAYVSFMSDDHLLKCIEKLFNVYDACSKDYDLDAFYKNKVDPIKIFFDTTFSGIDIEDYINSEINRKNDKTISNAIGDFHQNLLDGIAGFEAPQRSGYDVRRLDNTIFGELKNKHNTMNSSSAQETFNKLYRFATDYPDATCYLIEIIATKSQDILWEFSGNSHPRIRRISADNFYWLATGQQYAFIELCEAIPMATIDFLNSKGIVPIQNVDNSKVFNQLYDYADQNDVDIMTQIFIDTFSTYHGYK